MEDKKIILLDIESTGLDEKDRLCEIAYKWHGSGEITDSLFKPPIPISYEAMAVNHITNEAVENEPSFKDSTVFNSMFHWFNKEEAILVAHNARFDVKMLKREGINTPNVICTMKIVRHMDVKSKLTNYKLQYIRYRFGLNITNKRVQSHNAADDVVVLEALFDWLIEQECTIEKMLKITSEPQLLRVLPFGKHKGEPCRDVPLNYWNWLGVQNSIDEDLRHTIDYHMKRLTG